jgi:hypothetical protein
MELRHNFYPCRRTTREQHRDQMTEIYCFVDDYLRAHLALLRWRRSPHCAPRFTDSEVITIADLGYRGPDCAESLAEDAEMLLITRADAPERKFLLSQVRQGVETMFSQW